MRFEADGNSKDEIARLKQVMAQNTNIVRSSLEVGN